MPRPSFLQLILLTGCASLVLAACGPPSGTSGSDNRAAEAAGREALAEPTSSPAADTAGDFANEHVFCEDDDDIPYCEKTVSFTPEAVNNNLVIEVPLHVAVNVAEGDALSVDYKFVAPNKEQLRGVDPEVAAAVQSESETRVALRPLDTSCVGIGIFNGTLVHLKGLCLHSVQVTVPEGREIDVRKTSPERRSMTLVWSGRVPTNGGELLAAIKPVFGDEDKVVIVERFVKKYGNAEVGVPELEAIVKNIMFTDLKIATIKLLAPLVRKSNGKLNKQDIQGIVDEMFFDTDKEQVTRLLLD